MKKSEIIEEYNSLTSKINSLLDEYKETTGKTWEPHTKVEDMHPHMLNYAKNILETELDRRKSSIHSIEEAIRTYIDKQRLLSTEHGRNFLKSYEEKKKVLEKRSDEIEMSLMKSFEDCLIKAGMKEWKIPVKRMERIVPRKGYAYFDIEHMYKENANLSITIDIERKFRMDVSSSIHCGGERDVTVQDENYWQFKGYVAIHDNHQIFIDWMNNEYRKANIELTDIRNEIERVEKVIEDPMGEYIMLKVEEKIK